MVVALAVVAACRTATEGAYPDQSGGGCRHAGDYTSIAGTYDSDNVREGVAYVQTGPARNLHRVLPDGAAAGQSGKADQ
jgi:hypothetical protein